MTGEENFGKLLRFMNPRLGENEFVFCSFTGSDFGEYSYLSPEAAVLEDEGISLVVLRDKADKYDLKYDTVFKKITLSVHSGLDAVGLTATVSGKLSEKDIPANMIAGFYHDHIFVPVQRAEEAMAVLKKIKPV
ncbi:MAG: ACT domain-containing protein [Flexistipes sinusarabici]|uniref:ACT domain-containing protein n=1 Tax=Flexistipes sinusarabici TaxID=2352 RepID=A0A5D0MMY5_FLESI|nr:ACT domain-containing protein [Flexistipes sinusarabici]TYB32810.1 MAG: ACT domain-containing protein [Flexistipes sinusarabici]